MRPGKETLINIPDMNQNVGALLNNMQDHENGEALLRATLDLVPDLIVLKDGAGRWLFANRLVLETHSLTEEQCLKRTDLELILIRPELQEIFEKNVEADEKAWAAGSPLLNEKILTGSNGKLTYWEVVKTPIFDAEGERKCLIVVSRNITERKENEKALKAQELQYRLIANHMTDIVSMMKPNGEIIYVSPSLKRVLGHSPDSLEGSQQLKLVHPEDTDKLTVLIRETASKIQNAGREDIRLLHRCGLYIWFEIAVSLVQQNEREEDFLLVTARDISIKKDYELQLQSMAFRDSLTGIANRRHLMTRLEEELGLTDNTPSPLAILYLDVDKFKKINDTLGHAVGDELLQQIAQRIGDNLREGDLVARIGGDEFVVLLPNTDCAEQIEGIAKRLCAALSRPWQIGGHEFSSTSSLGIALSPQHGQTPAELLHCADRALYAAKREGRACTRFYQEADEPGDSDVLI
ncbi:diguanylate cyclase domain-containing protein [Saccharibacillus kuerlensis]|uniref:Diguanylate cyclase n=1 Tax=Saccharibacillus kuerlensis TaxID=459527 RepID=A0ABQ2KX50_9BACL|nr:diguanylate cyclase [Saccharibacillus kuerlensis]GGN95926.1 hypothetical protein GCM10010969_12300 [Saccharibacillus kuerlensis]